MKWPSELAVTQPELERLMRDATAVSLVSLSRKFIDGDSNREMQEMDVLEDRQSRDPVEELTRNDLRSAVLRHLSPIERLIVTLYYFEEMTMKEIGATLDLSESRVSQMHSSILNRLRAQFIRRPTLAVAAIA